MKAMTISGWKVFTILACISATMCVVQAQAPTFVTCQNYLTPAAGVPLPLAVDFTLPTAEDSDGNTVEVFCSHQPGDRFPLGKTEVTCNATVGSDKSTCKFEVGVGDATNCTRGYKACSCISAIDRCTCKIGYSGVDCGVEDGTNCIDGNTPSPGCGPSTCFIPACRCDNGWQGPSCDVVDDGSFCYVGGPPHCFACFVGDDPPCVCELGYQGKECEKDYLPPAFLFCPADFFVQAADDEDSAKASWNDPTAEDNSGVAPTISCDHISGSRFTAGSTRVTCTASDGENNMSHCTFNITVSDEKIPNITCPGNGVWNVDAESAFATVVLSPAPKAVDNIDGLVVVTCFGNLKPIGLPEDQYPVGETFVKCYANDSSANQASCSFTVTVLDNEGPVVMCPRNIVNNVEPGMPDAAVNWPPPTAEDVVEGPIPVVNCTDHNGKNAESGDRFPARNTTITCSAFDSVGNQGNCSFLITVNDNEAPIMTCPANISRNVDPGQSGGTIDWPTEPSANDTVDGPLAVKCYDDSDEPVNSGDEFSVRDTVVTCKASDASHNEGSCSFIITVIDNEDPLISCPESIFKDLEAGSAVGIIDWPTLPSANDIVDGPLAVTCHDESDKLVSSGDEFSVGETVVTCKASDNSNNEANCSFTINLKACDPCQNGGHSQDPDTCVCQCPGGFTGPLCSECKECVNGGNQDEATCVCNCFNSFQGPLCDVCPSDMQCGNGGEFDETSCKCNCRSPWTGPTCTECTPCANDGSNQDPDTCICDCPGVYLPPVCAECGGVTVCQNDGVFSDVFCNCTCLSPFEGKTCTECEPCQNGGSYQNKFTCVCDCPYFHTDPLCTVCPLEFVCLNGATRQEAACSCECADGWRGTDCSEPIPNIPDDEYPVSPIWTVSVEKKVSFEIAVIAPVGSGMECDPSINKFSNACNALVLEFKLSVEIEYKFVAGFSRVVIDQDKLRAGSVVVPHDVMYNYDEMTPTTRGISANALYEATVGKAVDRGYIGKLKVATGCEDCMAPQDKTYICDADPPECAAGLVLTQSTNGGVGTCYYVCWSKCKVDPTNCGDGTCHQESGSEKITCNCPQSSEVMYSGTQCQLQVQLVWLYVGVSLGGVLLLVLIIVLSVCLWRRRGKVHKFQDEDEEKEELHRPVSGKVIKELRSYHNDGNNRDMFFQEAATIPSHASPYAQVHKSRSSKAIKHGEANGAWKHGEANGAWPGALPRARARPLSEGQKDETKIKSSDFNGNEGGDRRSWYFWGSMSLPKKQPTEMIRMTSESGRF